MGTFGSGIKTVQRGIVTLDANPDTVTITAVVLAKSFLIISCSPQSGTSSPGGLVQATLTNTTTITLTQVTTGNSLVDWQVVEYY